MWVPFQTGRPVPIRCRATLRRRLISGEFGHSNPGEISILSPRLVQELEELLIIKILDILRADVHI
jgi:hypothetical protein